MLKMRLQRVGRIHEPSFRLVLTDSKNSTKSGRFSEILGSYDPRKSSSKDDLKAERIKYWLSQGALPTDTVHNLLIKKNIINGKKIHVAAKSKKPPVEATPVAKAPAEAPAESTPEPVSTETQAPAPESDIIEPVEEKTA